MNMRITKRIIALAGALALLTGCGQGTPAVPAGTPEPTEVQEAWGAEIGTVSQAPVLETVPPADESAAGPALFPAQAQTEPESSLIPEESPEPQASTPAPEPSRDANGILPPDGTDQELESRVEARLAEMNLEQKVAQLFIVTPEALLGGGAVTQAGEGMEEAFDAYPVGGFILMSGNLVDWDQTAGLLGDLSRISSDCCGLRPLLCVDEEGGTVARIGGADNYDVPEYPPMAELGAQGDLQAVEEAGTTIGSYLSALGFNVDFAPVADVLVNPENTVVRSRAFGSDPETVTRMASAFAGGLQSQGVLGCYKHFPGHGATAEDSHDGFAYSGATLEELRERELVPFADGVARQIPMIMVGHISLPNVTGDDTPASLSETVITGLLRQELGYDGLVITDALNMGAIVDAYGSGDAAVRTLLAGADLLLMPEDFYAAYEAVRSAAEAGTLTEQRLNASVRRILRVKLRLSE